MWQRDSHTVAVRWTLRCVPRLSPGRVAKPLALDGISEYRFDSRGFIREHSVRRLRHTITPISWPCASAGACHFHAGDRHDTPAASPLVFAAVTFHNCEPMWAARHFPG